MNTNERLKLINRMEASGKFERAKSLYIEILREDPDNSALQNNFALLLERLGDANGALKIYDRLVQSTGGADNALYLFNRGTLKKKLGMPYEAAKDLFAAIKIKPAFSKAYNNLASIFIEAGDRDQAKKVLLKCIQVDSEFAPAWANLASVYRECSDYKAAIAAYEKSLSLGYKTSGVLSQLGYALSYEQEWEKIESHLADLLRCGLSHDPAPPFALIAIDPSPERSRKRAEVFSKGALSRPPIQTSTNVSKEGGSSPKIRVGYISSDFFDHATMRLFGDALLSQDEKRFEIKLINTNKVIADRLTLQLEKKFSGILDVSAHSYDAAVRAIQALNLDIVIDLKGHTAGSRLDLFYSKLGKVSATFLGYPGTTGHPGIDYIIADDVVIPPGDEKYYSESVVRIDGCYQPNLKLVAADKELWSGKSESTEGFRFCNFNSPYKLSKDDYWRFLEIVKATPESTLTLMSAGTNSEGRLFELAESFGVSASRIIFTEALPWREHIIRMSSYDLFLDNHVVAAHTTCSDSLRSGLPILAFPGKTFASRVSESLLTNVGMRELIAQSENTFIDKAIKLASDRQYYRDTRERMLTAISNSELFNPDSFARRLEGVFVAMLAARC